jgi:hypothetical protein
MRMKTTLGALGYLGALSLAACDGGGGGGGMAIYRVSGGLAYVHCQTINPRSVSVSAAGLNTKIFGVPVSLGSAQFSSTSIASAGQELQILAADLSASCQEELRVDPNTAAGQILYSENDVSRHQLTAFAMQLSTATNDEQVNAATLAAQNASTGTKSQASATPPGATTTPAAKVGSPNPTTPLSAGASTTPATNIGSPNPAAPPGANPRPTP